MVMCTVTGTVHLHVTAHFSKEHIHSIRYDVRCREEHMQQRSAMRRLEEENKLLKQQLAAKASVQAAKSKSVKSSGAVFTGKSSQEGAKRKRDENHPQDAGNKKVKGTPETVKGSK